MGPKGGMTAPVGAHPELLGKGLREQRGFSQLQAFAFLR